MDTLSNELETCVKRLDGLVPQEDAWIEFFQYGGGPDESGMKGNKSGFLRLGIELLKGAIETPDPKSRQISVNFDDLLVGDPNIRFEWFEVDERPKEPDRPAHRMSKLNYVLAAVGCWAALLFVVTDFVVGAVTIASWFGRP